MPSLNLFKQLLGQVYEEGPCKQSHAFYETLLRKGVKGMPVNMNEFLL